MDRLIDHLAVCSEDNHYDIAKTVYSILQNENITDYSYKNLSNFCSTVVFNALLERARHHATEAARSGENFRDILEDKSKHIINVAYNLKKNGYKKIIIKELEECFL